MNTQFTITISGQDHPQLINQLASTTHKFGGKWLNSKISRLEQQLVGIIKIEIPEESADQLKQAFTALEELHIRIVEQETPTAPSTREQIKLKIESGDRPGIVRDITDILEDVGIHIIHMENHRLAIPEFGQVMFFAELDVDVPTEVDLEQLVETVQDVEDNMRVEVIS